MSESQPLWTQYVSQEQYMFIQGGVDRGLSANAILRSLSDAGIGVNRANGLAAVRWANGSVGSGQTLANTPYAFYPSESAFYPAPFVLDTTYRVSARVATGVDEQGNTTYKSAIFGFDQSLTREQIDAGLLDALSAAADAYDFTLDAGSIEYMKMWVSA